jgi:hypothetical protein
MPIPSSLTPVTAGTLLPATPRTSTQLVTRAEWQAPTAAGTSYSDMFVVTSAGVQVVDSSGRQIVLKK